MRGHSIPSTLKGRFRSLAIALFTATALGVLNIPAQAQVVDLDADLASLLSKLLAVPSSASDATRLSALDDVAGRLLAPDGLLSDISAEILNQEHLLDLQAGDLASLRVGLSDLRSATDLTDLRATVGSHTATLAEHERRIDGNSVDIATLSERTAVQGKDIQRLNGDVADHEARITELETSMGDVSSAEGVMIDDLDSRMNLRMDQMNERIDTANEGVAMAMALKSPYVPEDKSFALSGGWGNFEGRNAFGVSGAVRAGRSLQIDAGVAVGAGRGSVGGRAGATLTW